jgi:putative tricarboxylic transport membrane protein
MTTQRLDIVLAGVLVLLGAGVLYAAAGFAAGTEADPLGPRGFPTVLGVGFIGCGIALLAKSLLSSSRQHDESAETDPVAGPDDHDDSAERGSVQRKRLVLTCAAIAVYVVALSLAGFLLTTPVFVAALIMVQGGVRRVAFATTVVAFPIAVYLLFTVLLDVELPVGVFDPLSLVRRSLP